LRKTILMTGAGSGLGEGTAIGLAHAGHDVIATAQIPPQVAALREKAAALGLQNLKVEKLDILDRFDVAQALAWDIDILVDNAGIGECGPVSEVPVELVRRSFEVNLFAPLALTQGFVRRWIEDGKMGKIVFTSSTSGLFTPPGFGVYASTQHALEAVAKAMRQELAPFGIKVQTINPGAYLTGFNETMADTPFRWLDDARNFTKRAANGRDDPGRRGQGAERRPKTTGRHAQAIPRRGMGRKHLVLPYGGFDGLGWLQKR
jgi:NAD(P)-dependent dehydrogenase (short-subunit alcohol dehydrogenase family)